MASPAKVLIGRGSIATLSLYIFDELPLLWRAVKHSDDGLSRPLLQSDTPGLKCIFARRPLEDTLR